LFREFREVEYSVNSLLTYAMHYPIPASPQEIVALRQNPLMKNWLLPRSRVIKVVRAQGQSLEHPTQVLADDSLLDLQQRRWLSDVVAAWESFS